MLDLEFGDLLLNWGIMKLIKILKTSDGYEVKTLLTYKFLGKQIFSREQTYIKSKPDKNWYVSGSNSDVSEQKQAKLNKWLNDHKKFIEKE